MKLKTILILAFVFNVILPPILNINNLDMMIYFIILIAEICLIKKLKREYENA